MNLGRDGGDSMDINKLQEQIIFTRSGNSGKARCEEGWNWNPPPLHDYDLWYALSGRGEMRIQGQSYPIRKGSCFLVRPGDSPQATQLSEDRLQVIFIHFQYAPPDEEDASRAYIPERHTVITETYAFETMLNRIMELEERKFVWKELEFDLIMKQLWFQLLRSQANVPETRLREDKHGQLLSRVVALIKDVPGYRISHQELADQVSMSPEYLNKLFKRNMGMSLKHYMTEARLERALHLLQETSMNVSQVAEALGYGNIYLFSRQFKEQYGRPPSDFKFKGVASRPHGGKEQRDS
ncbi:AraC family transcriptional regulator [Paenibacillus sp. WQ 127069]|uniref:AraC family transcriptional regulator n=1 Tax=Paenibacillus baimaensis TaxID=2982185 RepID=A0ABT2UGZ2_9BACL|nr:AraC family transcriptional regulator [Paenibacillus sp. WQ 127069]MCU6793909.1 AraC family transcriptional regulator [Paenibacillus sp. WQ 127069]